MAPAKTALAGRTGLYIHDHTEGDSRGRGKTAQLLGGRQRRSHRMVCAPPEGLGLGSPRACTQGGLVHQMRRPAYTQAASPCSMLRSPGQVKGEEKTGRGVYALQRRECSWGPQEEPETRSSPPTSSAAELSGIARFLNSKTAPAGGRVVGHAVASKGILLGFQNLKMRKAPPSKGGAAPGCPAGPPSAAD